MAKRQQHTAAFKAHVALSALKGGKTIDEVAAQFGVPPTLIRDWKKKLLAGRPPCSRAGPRPPRPTPRRPSCSSGSGG